MNRIFIKHNPFVVKTEFIINGEVPAESFGLNKYHEIRLQRWVENIFFELQDAFNGNGSFFVEFQGVESDFMDIKEAASIAGQSGMVVELEWTPVKPTEQRLDEVKALMSEVEKNPKFAAYIEENSEVKKGLEAAFDNNFDVYVVATMSSGKSTLINAMIGHDLLPALNEATTATIAQIIDNKSTGDCFSGVRIDQNGIRKEISESLDLELMKRWNQEKDTAKILLEGNIASMAERDNVQLRLTDTPGPNNSQDEDHELTTMGYIQDSKRNPLILYVLNATQLGTNDDKKLLNLVAETMRKGGKQSKDRFIFVINKMDAFDPEKGENIASVISNVKKYLKNNGIDEPNVYPVSAQLTRLLRKHPDTLTRSDRGDKNKYEDLFFEEECMDLPQYMPLSSKVREALNSKKLDKVMYRSGLPAVETMIDEYIDKYNFPTRLARAESALRSAIEHGLQEADLIKQLDKDQKELVYIQEQVELLKERKDIALRSNRYKEKITNEGVDIPKEIKQQLAKIEADISHKRDQWGKEFIDETQPEHAREKLEDISNRIEFYYKELINKYSHIFEDCQEMIKEKFHADYMEYVASLFPESKELDLPVFQNLKENISSISINMNIGDKERKSKRVFDYRERVSAAVIYKPWTWLDTKAVTHWKTVEYVDLNEVWKGRATSIVANFMQLKGDCKTKIRNDKEKLVDKYIAFIDKEFSKRFDDLLNGFEEKLRDREVREKAIAKAREDHAEISRLKRKLEDILTV